MRDALRSLPLLAGLSTLALELLDQHVRESTVPAGHFVVREGEPGRHLFLIDRGSVRIFKRSHGAERDLARLGEGGFFGEMGVIDREGRSANVVAVAETRLLILSFVAFEILADQLPLDYARFLENLARELIRRLRELDERFATVT